MAAATELQSDIERAMRRPKGAWVRMSLMESTRFQLAGNPGLSRTAAYDEDGRADILSDRAFEIARSEITSWTGYRETPLRELPGLARALGIGRLYYKDESGRFGIGSFKALGGAYAVFRLIQKEIERATGKCVHASDILSGAHKDVTLRITVTCATDGNHGRSVAWGAQMFGCRCVIYVHASVSEGRCNAIARYGAEVRRVSGNYDDAVRQADQDARANGWFVVSDTSYEGYVSVPRDVMQGYSVMADEALRQMPSPPTHVFVQGGVGGLAASVCAHLWQRYGGKRPVYVVVEPEKADCLYRSAVAGRPTVVHGALDTIMAGLACGEVSLLAWKILQPGADAFMTVTDEAAAEMMRILASGRFDDRPIVSGESAVAGLVGLALAATDQDARARLALGPDSIALVIGTEGATDEEVYRQIVGRTAEQVRAAA
jgi:diaminopropionate ammonia-lyase